MGLCQRLTLLPTSLPRSTGVRVAQRLQRPQPLREALRPPGADLGHHAVLKAQHRVVDGPRGSARKCPTMWSQRQTDSGRTALQQPSQSPGPAARRPRAQRRPSGTSLKRWLWNLDVVILLQFFKSRGRTLVGRLFAATRPLWSPQLMAFLLPAIGHQLHNIVKLPFAKLVKVGGREAAALWWACGRRPTSQAWLTQRSRWRSRSGNKWSRSIRAPHPAALGQDPLPDSRALGRQKLQDGGGERQRMT